ncbi:MAG TPA: hypothetical protein ENN07_06215 [candidate division Zixibacteria bacterium]|nr:hypothetical protein [candidate division Zixibacteria bacterium]
MRRLAIYGLLLLSISAMGQYYFGKNKIQYKDYDWQRLRTEHFDIYFFGAEEELARITAYEVESFWKDHVASFRFVPRVRVPVIVYPTPNLFQETNVIPWILPEGLGGFTEYFKGRVVLPFNGDYADFRHTLKHELVHAFILHKNTFVHDAHELFFLNFLPLWFEEGLAEHLSEGTSPEMDMVIRSGALEQTLVPLEYIYSISGTFLMYKQGQSFLDWLAREYGARRIPLVINDIHDFKYFDDLFEAHFGISIEEAGRRWMDATQERYWPMITEGDLPHQAGRMVTSRADGMNLSPIMFVPENDTLPCMLIQSTRMNYSAVYRNCGAGWERVVRGGFSEKVEDMRLFNNSFSASKNGVLAISVKAQGSDVLTFVDLQTGEILHRRRFDSIPGIASPKIDETGHRVAFSGTDLEGFADIFIYFVEEDSLVRLTKDIYGDFSPAFLGDYILFDSDRNEIGEKSICRIPLNGGEIEFLEGFTGRASQASATDGGTILLTSSHHEEIQNIWEFLPDSMIAHRRTNILTGLFEPTQWRGDSVLATVYTKNSYQIIALPADTVYETIEVSWEPWSERWKPRQLTKATAREKIGYDTKFSFDIAQGTISTSTAMQSSGGIEGLFSDMLGDRQIYFMVYDEGRTLKDFLNNFNMIAVYYDASDRPVWGAGAYHLYNEGFNIYDWGFSVRNAGFIGSLSYPFSRFMRIDATGYLEYSKKTFFAHISPDREGGYASLNLSLVRDNAHWGRTGPIEGFRANTTIGGRVRLNDGEFTSRLASADLRYYLRLSRRSSLATRLVGRTSDGSDPQRFWMGGTWDFRGFPFYSFYGRNLVFASTELRFPVLDHLRMRFPFADINLRGINGAVFADVGQAWEDERKPLLGSTGVGLRMNLGNITCLRFDVAWKTDFHTGFQRPYYDIFFGWDF